MTDPQDNSRGMGTIVSGIRWSIALRFIGQGFSWISTIIVVRFISPEDYGLNSMLEAPLELLLLASTSGLDIALVRAKFFARDDIANIFGWLLFINGLLFTSYFFGASYIAAYFHEPQLTPLAQALAFVFLLVPFRVIPNAKLDRELKFRLRSIVELVSNFISAVTTLTLAVLGAGVWALVIGVLSNRVVLSILLMIKEPWFISPRLNFWAIRSQLTFGGIIISITAIVIFTDKLASLLAGPVIGADKLGLYAVALQFSMLPLAKVMPAINPVIFPTFSKLKDDSALAASYLERSLGVYTIALLPAMVGMACCTKTFVLTVLGSGWQDVISPLMILSLLMPLRLISFFLRPIVSSLGNVRHVLYSTLITLLATLISMTLLMDYGIWGLLGSFAVGELVSAYVGILICKCTLPTSFRRLADSVKPAVFSSIVMALTILPLPTILEPMSPALILMAQTVVGATTYFATLRLLFSSHFVLVAKLLLGR